jgi:hypothetical protein
MSATPGEEELWDDRREPNITLTEAKRRFQGTTPRKISAADRKRWYRLALEFAERGSRIRTMQKGPERTRLKQQQRATNKQLVEEMFQMDEGNDFTWPNGVCIEFDPHNRIGTGTWQHQNDELVEVRIFRVKTAE